jgi:hypothetical protein
MILLGLIQTKPNTDWIDIPVTIVQILDDTGQAGFFGNDQAAFTEQSAASMLREVNQFFAPARIQFTLSPRRAFEYKRSTLLYFDFSPVKNLSEYTDKSQKPPENGRSERTDLFRKLVLERPKTLHIFLRRGLEHAWNPQKGAWEERVGFSRGDSQFVRLASKDARVWAHELGHLMGLPHTCREGVDAPKDFGTRAAVESALSEFANNNPSEDPFRVFDGDVDLGIEDTPPDPGPSFWKAIGKPSVTLTLNINGRQRTNFFDRRNIMHATAELGGFSKDQITAMRSIAGFWRSGLPVNLRNPEDQVFEFEKSKYDLPKGQSKKTLRIGGTTPDHSCVMFELKPEEHVTFKFDKIPTGAYEVWFSGMRGSDHGAFEATVQPEQAHPFSLYFVGNLKSPSKAETGWLSLGSAQVTSGSLEVKLKGLEHTGFSNGYLIGVDALKLIPIKKPGEAQ